MFKRFLYIRTTKSDKKRLTDSSSGPFKSLTPFDDHKSQQQQQQHQL
jgi:hypothetical protein